MLLAQGPKSGTLCTDIGCSSMIVIANGDNNLSLWHNRLVHMSKKWTNVLALKDSLPGLK